MRALLALALLGALAGCGGADDAAVFVPLGDSRYRLLAKLPASAWPQLVER